MELITLTPLWWLLLLLPWLLVFRGSLVDAPFWKRALSFGLRVLGFVLLLLALCRPYAHWENRDAHVVFLVDVSQSVDLDSVRETLREVESAVAGLRAGDGWTLYAMADGVRPFSSPAEMVAWIDRWQEVGSDDRFRGDSRLGAAVLHARQVFPSEKAKRLVFCSDGQETRGELDDALRQVAEEGIEVLFRPIQPLRHPEAAVVALTPSTTRAFMGEVVRMTVDVRANQNLAGQLRMVHRGVVVQEQAVQLVADQPNRFYFDVDMVTPGASRWTVELIPEQDHFLINNFRSCTLTVRGQPRVLFLHQRETELRPIVRALQEQDFSVEVRGKFGVPDSLGELLSFDAVVLADLPATAMTQRQMELLRRYVVDFGGGLAMLGSENSFGLGGYHRTPVEEVLPLVSRYEKEREKPSLAMVLVIDKSGSMEGVPMMLAREAAKSAVEVLSPRDQIGVVGFDSEPLMVSEMRLAVERDSINAAIDTLAAGGGTSMYPAMLVARDMLEGTSAKIKHMICLSDGHTTNEDHDSLTQAMVDNGITVSTVALGDADRQLLARIAEIGRGRYYETNDPAAIPQIFSSETIQASRSAIKEDLYGSVRIGFHPALSGFESADLPFTLGYVLTQSKPTAQVLLVTDDGDPLLAIGRFGLGMGLAWSSDLSDRWGGEWLAWSDCGKYWGQLLRGIIRQSRGEGIQVLSRLDDDRWEVVIDKRNTAGLPESLVNWELATLDQQGRVLSFDVQETGLGRYRAVVDVQQESNMTLRLRDRDSDQMMVLHYDRPWPLEYNLSRKTPECLAGLGDFRPDRIRHDLPPRRVRVTIAHYFYFAALAAFLAGNLIRRL